MDEWSAADDRFLLRPIYSPTGPFMALKHVLNRSTALYLLRIFIINFIYHSLVIACGHASSEIKLATSYSCSPNFNYRTVNSARTIKKTVLNNYVEH